MNKKHKLFVFMLNAIVRFIKDRIRKNIQTLFVLK